MRDLDFSQWHPLDHRPGKACQKFFGGISWHLNLSWNYKWRRIILASTACKVGIHSPADAIVYLDDNDEGIPFRICHNCGKGMG